MTDRPKTYPPTWAKIVALVIMVISAVILFLSCAVLIRVLWGSAFG